MKARKLSVKLPSNRPSGEEIKQLEGYLRGLRESIPQRTVYEASQALGDWVQQPIHPSPLSTT